MARHRLRRRDGELVGVVAEDVLDRLRLGHVAERRPRAVRVDVADPLRLDLGAPSAARIISATPSASGSGCSHVVGVVRGAVAEHLGVDRARRASAPTRDPRA